MFATRLPSQKELKKTLTDVLLRDHESFHRYRVFVRHPKLPKFVMDFSAADREINHLEPLSRYRKTFLYSPQNTRRVLIFTIN